MRKRAAGARSGFSLVEVVIALGLTAFVVIAILGLSSSVLSRSRESKLDTLWVNIVQDATTQMRLTVWSDLRPTNYFYDIDGQKVPSKQHKDAFYDCEVSEVASPVANGGSAHKVFLMALKWPIGASNQSTQKIPISIARYE